MNIILSPFKSAHCRLTLIFHLYLNIYPGELPIIVLNSNEDATLANLFLYQTNKPWNCDIYFDLILNLDMELAKTFLYFKFARASSIHLPILPTKLYALIELDDYTLTIHRYEAWVKTLLQREENSKASMHKYSVTNFAFLGIKLNINAHEDSQILILAATHDHENAPSYAVTKVIKISTWSSFSFKNVRLQPFYQSPYHNTVWEVKDIKDESTTGDGCIKCHFDSCQFNKNFWPNRFSSFSMIFLSKAFVHIWLSIMRNYTIESWKTSSKRVMLCTNDKQNGIMYISSQVFTWHFAGVFMFYF